MLVSFRLLVIRGFCYFRFFSSILLYVFLVCRKRVGVILIFWIVDFEIVCFFWGREVFVSFGYFRVEMFLRVSGFSSFRSSFLVRGFYFLVVII